MLEEKLTPSPLWWHGGQYPGDHLGAGRRAKSPGGQEMLRWVVIVSAGRTPPPHPEIIPLHLRTEDPGVR